MSDAEVFGTAPKSGMTDEEVFGSSAPITGERAVAPGRGVADQLLGLTGPRYQTFPERAARNVGSIVKNLIDSAKVAPPGSRESVEAEAGPAFEAATVFSPLRGSSVPFTLRGAAIKAPSQEQLRGIISGQYRELGKTGIQIPQKDVADLAQEIRQDLMHGQENGGHRQINEPGTFAALDELEKTLGRFTDIDSVRKVLGKIRMNAARNASDAHAAAVAIRKIDDFLTSRTGETGELAKATRGNVTALKRSEDVTRGRESGELGAATTGSGANAANRIRQNIKWFIDPKYPQRQLGFKPDEIELMKAIATGGGRYSAENIARLVAKLGPDHPLSGWGGALLSGHGMVTLPIGAVAQWLSEKMVLNKVERLDEMIRSRAPAAGPARPERLGASGNSLTKLYGAGLVPALAGAPDRYQTQQLQDVGL